MTPDQKDLLIKARESLGAAKHLLAGGYSSFAVSRAYYAMFYVAEAFLEGEGMSFSKHSGVIAAFGEHFAHKGRVPPEFHRMLIDAEKLRISADYGKTQATMEERVRRTIADSQAFVELGERLIL